MKQEVGIWWLKNFLIFAGGSSETLLPLIFLLFAIPILILWELLPRLSLVPQTLVPTPSVVALTFWDLLQTTISWGTSVSACRGFPWVFSSRF